MLELNDVGFSPVGDMDEWSLLRDIDMKVGGGHLMAIIGPSGCGKTTLLKTIAGINEATSGSIHWRDRDLDEEGDFEPNEFGYVPQFAIGSEALTVSESIHYSLSLRSAGLSNEEAEERIELILEQTGLAELADRQISLLSGGQKRRLSLATELVADPHILLCDEVTSGLDVRSEQEITTLLRSISRQHNRVVISVTHSLGYLDQYDSIAVLHDGHLIYHGSPEALTHYFSVESTEDIYPRLSKRPAADWASSWQKHRTEFESPEAKTTDASSTAPALITPISGFLRQFYYCLARRTTVFFRQKGQLFLQLALILGFPLLVVIFALDGVAPMQSQADTPGENPLAAISKAASVAKSQAEVGGLVSGLTLMQVILLTLMGANNSAREIAGERLIFEKEKLTGLRPGAYLLAKIVFLVTLCAIQSLWMAVFVDTICRIPGDLASHALMLFLANIAMTFISLAISSFARSPEQASLLSIYLVGFQLPLSGAILALPDFLQNITRPFITAYWGWSGQIMTLNPDYRTVIVSIMSDTQLMNFATCLLVLLLQAALSCVIAYFGCRASQWQLNQ